LAKKHGVIIAHDCAYSEIYFDDKHKPSSLLEIRGASDVAIEFHSLSKTFNMTGWRLGFAVGNRALVAGLLKLKTQIDSGPFLAIQQAGALALDHAEELTAPIRKIYSERQALVMKSYDKIGIEYAAPAATFYIWARAPDQMKSIDFAKSLLKEQDLVVTPGIGFGKEGEHFFRISLTVDTATLNQAMERLRMFLMR
jgi:LL-diaminopimelate aminotransferase